MSDYLQDFVVGFVIVLFGCAFVATVGIGTARLTVIYGPIAIFVVASLMFAIAAGVGFANDERRKRGVA